MDDSCEYLPKFREVGEMLIGFYRCMLEVIKLQILDKRIE